MGLLKKRHSSNPEGIYSMAEFTRNKSTVLSTRLSKEKAERLRAVAESRNLPIGMLVRVVLNEFLSGRSASAWF